MRFWIGVHSPWQGWWAQAAHSAAQEQVGSGNAGEERGSFIRLFPALLHLFIYLFTAQAALAPEAGNVCRPAALPKQAGSANT